MMYPISSVLQVQLQRAPKAIISRSAVGKLLQKCFSSQAVAYDEIVRDRKDLAGRFGRYQEEYDESLSDKRGFWLRAASGQCID